MKFYCVGNWKMNMTSLQAAEFIQQLKAQVPEAEQSQLVILPPALFAFRVAEGMMGTKLAWGGQNVYSENKGAFTGENSPLALKEMGAQFCLVGHSERRHVFGEGNELLAKKVEALQANGLTPILCVGEKLEERQQGKTSQVILQQLAAGLKLADPAKPIWIAYEPVWAIGTGLVASPKQVEEAHSILRSALNEWSASASQATPILYGGSVKSDNVKSLKSLKNVNGFLIGGASLDVQEYLKIYRLSQ